MNRLARIHSVLLISLLGVGCTSVRSIVKDAKPMKQVYGEKITQATSSARASHERPIADGALDLQGDARSTYEHLQKTFPRLPNPELVMYITPHLTSGGRPVPGYSTIFPMYKETQYALPGEHQ